MYIGIDLGTSSVKTVLMNAEQQIVASASAPLDVQRPQEGWSEQQPADWIAGAENTFAALKSSNPKELAAVTGIGLSGHMHGATLVDGADKVLRPVSYGTIPAAMKRRLYLILIDRASYAATYFSRALLHQSLHGWRNTSLMFFLKYAKYFCQKTTFVCG